MHVTFDDLTGVVVEEFYAPGSSGIMVLRDAALAVQIMRLADSIEYREFVLKEYQNINNGQTYYHFTEPVEVVTKSDEAVRRLIEIEQSIRSHIASRFPESALEYGFTRYPVSSQGATFHIDFSYNVQCTITFFFGSTSMWIADTKEGGNKKQYVIEPGDIVILRAPRNFQKEELALRPVHAVGVVSEVLYAFEVREVVSERKAALAILNA